MNVNGVVNSCSEYNTKALDVFLYWLLHYNSETEPVTEQETLVFSLSPTSKCGCYMQICQVSYMDARSSNSSL